MTRSFWNIGHGLLAVLIALALWQVVAISGLVSRAVLATPMEALGCLDQFFSPSRFGPDTLATTWRSASAFLLSIPAGLAVGLLVFMLRDWGGGIESTLDFVRSIPSTALVPVFLVVFGIGSMSKIGPGVFSSTLVISLSLLAGLRRQNGIRECLSSMYGFTLRERFLRVVLPASAPQFFIGLRTGASLSLILVVVSEMTIGANRGLGKVVNDMRSSDAVPAAYAALLVLGAIGWAFNLIILKAQHKIIHWEVK